MEAITHSLLRDINTQKLSYDLALQLQATICKPIISGKQWRSWGQVDARACLGVANYNMYIMGVFNYYFTNTQDHTVVVARVGVLNRCGLQYINRYC